MTSSRPSHVLHIAEKKDWEARTDTYTPASFHEEGFVHCSTADQVDAVARSFYAGRDDLVLLTIVTAHVEPRLIYEDLYDAGELFPHIYSPVPIAAVAKAENFSVA